MNHTGRESVARDRRHPTHDDEACHGWGTQSVRWLARKRQRITGGPPANSVGTATYISNGGADYYANRTGIDFINTQTAPVVNTMAGITIGAVGFIGGAEIAAAAPEAGGLIQQAGAYRRFLSLRSAWTALSKATGAAGLIGTFFKTGQVPPGLTPEMMQSYLSLARAYIAAGLGGDAGLAEQTSRAEQLSQYLGK